MKKHIILLLFLLIPSMSFGAIVVSGPAVHGAPLEITDNTNPFGTKTGTQLRYDDYEVNDSAQTPTPGTQLNDNFAYWDDRGDLQFNPLMSNTENRSKSNSNVTITYTIDNGAHTSSGMAWHNNVGFDDTKKIYINYWISFKPVAADYTPTDARGYWQIKILQVKGSYDSSGAGSPTPGIIYNFFNYYGPDATYGTIDDYYNLNSGVQAIQSVDFTARATIPYDTTQRYWYNISYQVDQGTAGVANASNKTTMSEPNFSGPIDIVDETENFICVDSTYLDAVKLGWFLNQTDIDTGSVTIYYDNIYIDNSWARVEIGDNADYDLCTHREIQPLDPNNLWGPGIIGIIVNQGLFANGAAFLHVTLEDGTQLPSASITFADAPTPPATYTAQAKKATLKKATLK